MGQIIKFPKENKRFDLSNISMDPEEIAEEIRLIKMAYFSTISDEIVDDVLRSLSMLNLEDTPNETYSVEAKDLILLKESIISMLCKIIGLKHPLHELSEDNIIISETFDGEDTLFHNYRFKTDPEKLIENISKD
jgi:hypothetical protein